MLEKDDLKQIELIFNQALESRLVTILDSKFDEKLEPIKQELADIRFELQAIKQRLERIEKAESEDISAAYHDIETLKKQLAELEIKVQKLQAGHG